MLEALRGKKLLFVGDSLIKGQYLSMICLLHRLVPATGKSFKKSMFSITVLKLKVTIQYPHNQISCQTFRASEM